MTIEGDNQKQADFLASALAKVDPARVHDLHMVQSVLALPDHLAVFERGIANRLDFAFAGPQSRKLAELVANGTREDRRDPHLSRTLCPHAGRPDAARGARSSPTRPIATATSTPARTPKTRRPSPRPTAFRGGIVVAQVNEIVDRLPRVDVPGDWVDVVVPSPKPYLIDPLFTRDPAKIRNENVLMAMMAIAAVYEPYQVRRLNHGIGYATAAIELILPTFAAQRGLKGKIATHFVLNPHPTLIPAIEAGFVDSVYCFGSELGHGTLRLEPRRYISRSAPTAICGPTARSRRSPDNMPATSSSAPRCRSTRRATARRQPRDRITGFGGAPNMGADPRGRRHDSPTWLRAGQEAGESLRGRKLVVQMVQTHQPNGAPSFVERLDAFDLAASAGFALPPVMIYGDDVTHVVTERGVANLLRCRSPQEREAALRAVAGDTEFGKRQSPEASDEPAPPRHRDVPVRSRHRCQHRNPRLARGPDHRRPRDGVGRTLRAAGEIPPRPRVARTR